MVGVKYRKIFDLYKEIFDARQKSIFMEKRAEMLKKMKDNIYDSVPDWIRQLEICKF